MRNKYRILLLAASILTIGCTQTPYDEGSPETRPINVEITARAGLGIESRTALGDDGISVRWSTGDRIALWALDAGGAASFEAQPFELRHYDATYDEARFTGTVPAMTQGSYTYCAVSPQPATHDGTRVTYEIPAKQKGAFDGSLDVMVAEPVADAPALVEGLNSNFSLRFHHKIHLLRITIPANGNNLGESIAALELEFPQPIVGKLTLDAANPDAAPELTDGSNKLTIHLDHPVAANEEVCVYAAIAPISMTADDVIQIKAFGTGGSESQASIMQGKSFTAGHTTPIKYYVPERYRITRIFFSLAGRDGRTDLPEDLAGGYGCSTLGEPVTAFTLTGPEGVDLGNGTNVRTFEINRENLYEISYEGAFTDNLSGKPFTVTFESEHTTGLPYYESAEAKTAAEPYSFWMPQLTADSRNTIQAFEVPYLFEENFEGIQSFDIDTSNGTGSTSAGSNSASTLTGIPVSGSTTWSGARCAGETGKSIRICSRNECAAGVRGSYHGRVDSPNFEVLKTDCNVTVRFKYSIGRSANQGNFLQPYLAAGTTNDGNRDASSKTWGSLFSNGNPGTILQYNIPAIIYDLKDNGALDGSYDNIPLQGEYSATVSPDHRLVWEVYMKDGEPKETFAYYYSNNWAYIDDIQVSITR